MRSLRLIGGMFLTLWCTLSIVFFMVRAAPGGPWDTERALSPQTRATLQQVYGLDQPLYRQYLGWLGRIAQGDLGVSMAMPGQTVSGLIAHAFPVSLGIGAVALLVAIAGGIPLGYSWAARAVEGRVTYLLAMMPSFIAAPLAQQAVLGLGGAAYGYDGFFSLIIPGFVLGLYYLPFVARLTQVGFQQQSHALYLRVAQAKGHTRTRALWLHGSRAALGPVLAYLGPTAAGLITGSFIVETVWGLPGLGRYFVNAVFNRDDTLLLGLVAFYTIILLLFNTCVEAILARWTPTHNPRSTP